MPVVGGEYPGSSYTPRCMRRSVTPDSDYAECVPILIYDIEFFQLTNSDKRVFDFLFHVHVINECMSFLNRRLDNDQ